MNHQASQILSTPAAIRSARPRGAAPAALQDFLDFTVDHPPYRHGRATPCMHIAIRPVNEVDAHEPDYVLIPPWNLKDEIVNQMSHMGDWGGKFIVSPHVAVIDPTES